MSNSPKIPDFPAIGEGIKKDLRRYAKVYCLQWFDDSFPNQGFTDASFQPWPKREEAEFQFQYGAIKSRENKQKNILKLNSIQFI